MARKRTSKSEWKPLFEVETDNFKAQGTFKAEDTEGSFYGFVNVIVNEMMCIKASLINGKKGVFFSFPQNKVGKEYYDQVIPMNKKVSEELTKLAELCADEFDK